jgi:hypothetical protein
MGFSVKLARGTGFPNAPEGIRTPDRLLRRRSSIQLSYGSMVIITVSVAAIVVTALLGAAFPLPMHAAR